MPKYGYLVVEGPHDIEFLYRLLRPHGLRRVRFEADLDPYFGRLIPRTYPHDGDLQKRSPIPLFLQSATHAIAIHSVVGDSQLIRFIRENGAAIDVDRLTGIGILLDADSTTPPVDRYEAIRDDLRALGYPSPDFAGRVSAGPRHLGAYVLPDNQSRGTLEDVLLDCAGHIYPTLLASATAHVDAAAEDAILDADDRRDLQKPSGRNKAIIGSMASILKPGKAVQVSIQDNRWLTGPALALPRVRAISAFLEELLELP